MVDQKTPEDDRELQFDNTPNRLTLTRMALVPVVVGLLFLRTELGDWLAAVAFGVAGITDYFDGHIARTQKLVTVYGKLMDPLADKFLVVSSVIMLQELGRIHPVVVILLVCRELAITGLRALASAEGVIIQASSGGKWKTTFQMSAIPMVMLSTPERYVVLYWLGIALVYLSLGLSLWSAKDYIVEFFRGVREKRRLRIEEKRTRLEERARERGHARAARLAQRAKRFAAKARNADSPQ